MNSYPRTKERTYKMKDLSGYFIRLKIPIVIGFFNKPIAAILAVGLHYSIMASAQ